MVLCGHSMGGAITLLYALRYPQELKGIILLGTGARLRVHPDYLERCRQPGPNNSDWLAGHMGYFKGVALDMQPVLSQRAEEVGPEVELNDLLACDRFDVMDRVREIALLYPELSPREVACHLSDHGGFSVSESTVYRILKAAGWDPKRASDPTPQGRNTLAPLRSSASISVCILYGGIRRREVESSDPSGVPAAAREGIVLT